MTLALLGASQAEAQEEQNPPPQPQTPSAPRGAGAKSGGASRKKVGVNFEDQLIEGEVKRPELMSILQKKQYNFGRLIKLRENFLPEMRKTTEAIQRRGGGGGD
ncbi:MAG: hypothetical protein ABL958_18210 [Bdellovibrionia bacterium]